MSEEEAISLLTQVNKILVNSNSWLENTHEPLNMAFDMAIKALEQAPVLDKIRAEIENHCRLAKENHCKYCSYCNNLMGVREILEVIDKYRAESEE